MPSRSLNVNITGDVNPSFTRAMSKADKSAGDLNVRFGALSGSLNKMIPLLTRAAPAISGMAGVSAALGASLAEAGAGAGALGAGFAASLAPILVVGKQVSSRMDAIKEAYAGVVKAQQDGTAESKKASDEMLSHLSKNERAMVGSLGRLAGLQKKVLGGASDGVFGGVSRAIDALAPKLEGLSRPFTRLGQAIGDNIAKVGGLLASGPWQDAFKKFVDSASKIVGPITSIFTHIGGIFRDIAVAALPYVQKGLQGIADWFGRLDKAATSSKIRGIVDKLVSQTKSWLDLLGALGGLAGRVFGAVFDDAAGKGKGLVDTLTGVINAVNGFIDQMKSGEGAGGRFAAVVGGAFNAVKGVVQSVLPVIRDGAMAAFGWLEEHVPPIFEKVKGAAVVAFGWLQTNVPPVFDRIKTVVQQVAPVVADFAVQVFGKLKSYAQAAWPVIKDGAVAVFGWLKDNVPPVLEAVRSAAVTAFGWLKDHLPGIFSSAKGAAGSAFGGIKDAIVGAIKFIAGWFSKHEDDIKAFGKAWVNIGKIILGAGAVVVATVKEAFEHVLIPVFKVVLDVVKTVWPSIKKIIEGVLDAIGGVIQIFSGIFTGDFGRIWDGVKGIFKGGVKAILGIVGGILKAIPKVLGGLGGVIKDVIVDSVSWAARNVPKLIGKALGGLGKAIINGIKAGFSKLNPFGDGLGDGIGMIPSGGGTALAGGNNLMGAKSILAPLAGIAGRFGLHTSSGARPGSITSSGNVSWHASGNAIDEAGSPAGMLGYFRYLKNTWGPRLRELIYTPGGVGIKDGKPYRYTGKVAADHYDHVHVAFTGDGIGRKAGTGDGIGQLKSLWVKAGGSASAANMAAAIAMAESGGRNVVSPPNSDGSVDRGFWQINSIHGAMSSLDPLTNARAAVSISSNGRNWNPWTVYKTGAYRRFLTSGGSGGGTSTTSSGGHVIDTHTIHSSGRAPVMRNSAIYGNDDSGLSEEQQAAIDFGNARNAPRVGPRKGGGPTKGRSQEQADAYQTLLDAQPSEFDYLDMALADAEATPGSEDDRSALAAILGFRQRSYQSAVSTGDPRKIAQARRDLTSAENALKEVADNTAALTEALNGVRDEMKRQTDFATSVANTSNFQLTKTLADLISGQIVGYGVAGRSFTPGTGVEVAY